MTTDIESMKELAKSLQDLIDEAGQVRLIGDFQRRNIQVQDDLRLAHSELSSLIRDLQEGLRG
ncbi:MAG: hypothetical protein AAGI13_09205 [Pseudomonadota bacterium]